jgi:hypothetical protein
MSAIGSKADIGQAIEARGTPKIRRWLARDFSHFAVPPLLGSMAWIFIFAFLLSVGR